MHPVTPSSSIRYVGEHRRWPLSDHPDTQAGDSFDSLCRIKGPTLLLHGEADDICLVSQSKVAYHVLQQEKVPTALVVYPKEPRAPPRIEPGPPAPDTRRHAHTALRPSFDSHPIRPSTR